MFLPRRFRMHFVADLPNKTEKWGKGYCQIFAKEGAGGIRDFKSPADAQNPEKTL